MTGAASSRRTTLSPTLAETARRRADLHERWSTVEQAISRPAVGREPDWTKEVLLRLEGSRTRSTSTSRSRSGPTACTTRSRPRRPTWRRRSTGCARSTPCCASAAGADHQAPDDGVGPGVAARRGPRRPPAAARPDRPPSPARIATSSGRHTTSTSAGSSSPRAPSRLTLVRIALGQVDTTVGDLAGNVDLLTAWASRATEADADVVVFPELAITGYPPEDLVLRPAFVDDNLAALDALAAKTAGGCLDRGRVRRPDRARHPQRGGGPRRRPGDRAVPQDQAAELRRVRRGADVHAGRRRVPDPARRLRARAVGVRGRVDAGSAVRRVRRRKTPVILNINGSPFHRGKADERVEICGSARCETGAWIVYVNAVGGQDELVFDGGSVVVRAGRIARTPRRDVRGGPARRRHRRRDLERAGAPAVARGSRAGVPRASSSALRDYVRKNGFEEVVLGLSGGIDSRWSPSSPPTRSAPGRSARSRCRPPSPRPRASRTRGRWPPGSGSGSTCSRSRTCSRPTWTPLRGTFGGRQGRGRRGEPAGADPRQPADGDLEPLRLPGPGHRQQERVRGRLRDAVRRHGGGFAPIKDVPKTLVYELARWRNAAGAAEPPPIPRRVLDKPPSAELRPDQKDTDSLPPYEVLDPIVEAYVEDDRAPEDIIAERGLDPTLVDAGRRDDRPGRVQAPAGGARDQDHAEGVRARPAPADHEPLPAVSAARRLRRQGR